MATNYQTKKLFAVGTSVHSKNPSRNFKDNDHYVAVLVTTLKLAYEVVQDPNIPKLGLQNVCYSYNQVNNRMRKDEQVILWDTKKHECEEDAILAGDYFVIKPLELIKSTKKKKEQAVAAV